jgi:hypothetical protein
VKRDSSGHQAQGRSPPYPPIVRSGASRASKGPDDNSKNKEKQKSVNKYEYNPCEKSIRIHFSSIFRVILLRKALNVVAAVILVLTYLYLYQRQLLINLWNYYFPDKEEIPKRFPIPTKKHTKTE